MVELLSVHMSLFQKDRSEFERALPPAVLVFTPSSAAALASSLETMEGEVEERCFRTRTSVGVPMLGVGEPLVFSVLKHQENAFGRGITVGRTGNNDVVLDDGTVSRFHGWFQRDSHGSYTLTDAGSKNGTFLGGARLVARRATPVTDGTRLRFGQVEVTFFLPAGFLKMLARRGGM
jgi:hypothetical protein